MAPRPVLRAHLASSLAVAVIWLVVGCGSGDPSAESADPDLRVIAFSMTEMRFDPSEVSVRVGETVVMRFRNDGTVRHEAVVGDEATQIASAQQMQQMMGSSSMTTMAHGRAAVVRRHPGMKLPNAVSVEPGATGEIVFTFAKAGRLLIGCHETGHYEAGMVATIDVVP